MERLQRMKTGGRKRILFRILSAALALGMLWALVGAAGVAYAEPGEQSDGASLQIRFHHQEENSTPIPGAAFHLYKVAEPDETGALGFTEDFADCGIDLALLEEPDDALMLTLAAYAQGAKRTVLAEGKTDETGRLNFRGLSAGLYLAIGFPVTLGNPDFVVYTPQPFAVYLPAGEHVTVEPKFTMDTIPKDGPTYTQRRVLKIWKDEGYEKKRPTEITVQLLRDGELYHEVTLNAGNNWRYEWDSLPGGSLYLIYEKDVPSGYTATLDRQGITFTLTNSYQPTTPPGPGTTPENPPSKLPQTGLLWWPVPLLVGGGILLLAGGILLTCFGGSHRLEKKKQGVRGR